MFYRQLHQYPPHQNSIPSRNFEQVTANLCGVLDKLDNLPLDAIFVDRRPSPGLGRSINDGLQWVAE